MVPVPYNPNAEFGVAVWAKVFETESQDKADLDHLVADDPAVPGNLGGVQPPNTITETEWQILQTDKMHPSANELKFERQMGMDNQSVTRRYEFYKYFGPYEINTSDGPCTGTNEALCAAADPNNIPFGVGAAVTYDEFGNVVNIDCTTTAIVGDYIGAQNAAANVATPLTANGANLTDGEVGVQYPDRPLIFGGSGGPYSITFSGAGTLPDADPNFNLDSFTGVLHGGVPKGTGTSTFTVDATDLGDASQLAVNATFNIVVVDAVTVDNIVIPDGTENVETSVNLTASGGETPFKWAAGPSAGLQVSLVGNTLSLTATGSGAFDVPVTVDDSLGGTDTKTLHFNVPAAVPPTDTTTETPVAPTETPTNTPPPTSTDTPADTPTCTPTQTPTTTSTETPTNVPTATPTNTPTTTPANTSTQTPTHTPTSTRTVTPTNTPTRTPTATPTVGPTPPPTACGDLDGDGRVTARDVLIEAVAVLFSSNNPRFDINHDGRLTIVDLLIVIRQVGKSC